MPLTDRQKRALARACDRALARADPAWTATNAHDPGLTLLEVLAYVLDDLVADRFPLDPPSRAVARRIAGAAAAAAGANDGAEGCGDALARVRYFHGQLLSAHDFAAEQAYFRARLRRRNRLLHGAGVVTGLEVSVESSAAGSAVRVQAGFALDPAGEEIEVPAAAVLPLSSPETGLFVLVRHSERPCRLQPAAMRTEDGDGSEPSRIAECFSLSLSPAPAADAVAIGRLVRRRGRWRVDARFKVPRTG